MSDRGRQRLRTIMIMLATALVVAPAAALATHSFADVDDDDFFHAAVDWMKDNGVTVGCNPPNNTRYCPDQPVTRGEMAVFLERLDSKNVFLRPGEVKLDGGDADTLDGKDSTAFEQFGGTIPSGTTLTGNWTAAPSNGSVPGSLGWFEMTFPTTASAPEEVTASDSNMAGGTTNGVDNDPQCTGTADNPTAPAGKVCWYVGFRRNVSHLMGFGSSGDRTRGALLRVRGDGTSTDQYARGSWAYTAP